MGDPDAEAEFMARLLTYGDALDALDKKSDAEIADIIVEHVGAYEVPYTPKDALLDNAIDRLRRSTAGAVDRHECPRCCGTGERDYQKCGSCHGSGEEVL